MDPMAGGRIMSTVDVNLYGTVHGGVIMKPVDDAAGRLGRPPLRRKRGHRVDGRDAVPLARPGG
ncbi:MAG TPA: hypothetical protein VGD11_18470 [Mycobacteriales bacterium]